ncbi:MAG: hypothetical protein JW963_07770 [Anaerolineales bacterium]|nr:hypothetical protein [Anaerolineales bacterium]
MAKRVKESVPEEGIVRAEEPVQPEMAVVPAPEPEPVPEPEPAPAPVRSGPTFGQRARRFFGCLFSLVLALIVLGALAAGLYFGLPLVYQRYILPVQENTTQLERLLAQGRQNEQIISDLQTWLSAIETEQARQADSLAELDGRISGFEKEISAHTRSLETLEGMQATLQSQSDATNAELGRQIDLLKAMELLSRARLFMYQSNYGLAKQDVQTARDLLARVQPDAPDSLADDLQAVILRLDLTLSNLPDFPVAASDDLDIAWQILLAGLPEVKATVSETPIPEVTLTPTPQVTDTPTVTP